MNTYRIILWGAGNTAREALKFVSKSVKILGFFDNDPKITEFEGLHALDKENIEQYEYDYIVICSVYYKEIYKQLISLTVDESKILINPVSKAQSYQIYKADFFVNKWRKLLKRKKPEIFISGISYHNDGIQEQVFSECLGKEAFNFANRGQDIFYDFKIAELLNKNGFLDHATHYIIGLCYYSFEYDMSKSVNGWEIIRYYPLIKEQHNFAVEIPFKDIVNSAKSYLEKNEIYHILFNKECKHVVNDEEGRKTARADFNKNYPVTVWENKLLLKKFLSLLKEKHIKPIIVVMPAVRGYVKEVPLEFKERFYDALSDCINDVEEIQVLDYFGRYYGDISDYYHVSHLNTEGAKKFTRKLVEDISNA
mgnify:CR=1 FL=1